MFGSRTNCYGCHTKPGKDAKGMAVVQATQSGCVGCHGERQGQMLAKWKRGVALSMSDADEAFAKAQKALQDNKTATPQARQKAAELLAIAEADLALVKHANGIHNVTYAIELLDSVVGHCRKATAALAVKK
jgi:hypothetical protein